jgi:hypothetical protein
MEVMFMSQYNDYLIKNIAGSANSLLDKIGNADDNKEISSIATSVDKLVNDVINLEEAERKNDQLDFDKEKSERDFEAENARQAQRLSFEKEKLALEKEKLALEKEKLDFDKAKAEQKSNDERFMSQGEWEDRQKERWIKIGTAILGFFGVAATAASTVYQAKQNNELTKALVDRATNFNEENLLNDKPIKLVVDAQKLGK